MGYSLTFYSLDWEVLRKHLLSPSQHDMTAIRQSLWEQLLRERKPEEIEAAWLSARQEFSEKIGAGGMQSGTSATLGGDAALLWVALVQHFGQYLGELNHASAAGEEFLGNFLGDAAARLFEVPQLTEWLTGRSICQLESELIPSWGGTRREELSQMLRCYDRKPQKASEISEDCASWLEDLVLILREAMSARRDVVTLYM